MQDGRKRFRGSFARRGRRSGQNAFAGCARRMKPDTVLLPLEDIGEAKLVLTDDLITAALQAEKAALGRTRRN